MDPIEVKDEWDEKQLNAFYFNWLIILFNLVYKKDKIKEIFKLGNLPFEPTDSQINNWRKVKKNTPIFRDEYLTCFVNGLFILKNMEKIEFDNRHKLTFFYNSFIKLVGFLPDNLPASTDERKKLGTLITFLLNYKQTNNDLFNI